jgi:hypothetical protein
VGAGTPSASAPASANPCVPSARTPGPAASGVATPPADDLTPLSDEFDDAHSLSQWQNLNSVEGWPSQIQRLDVNTSSPGSLYLVPYTSTWWNEFHGAYLYKPVTGDFMVTTRIQATGKQGAVPTSAFSLTGLMARAPRTITPATWTPKGENWVFITTGIGYAYRGAPQIETKTTVNSESHLVLIPSQTGWIELRVVRVGQYFLMLYRLNGQGWAVSQCYERPDLPQTLQVGLNAYTDWNTIAARYPNDDVAFNKTVLTGPETHPDLITRCDYLRYHRPPLPETLRANITAGHVSLDQWVSYVSN